jgi:hypothetical protein
LLAQVVAVVTEVELEELEASYPEHLLQLLGQPTRLLLAVVGLEE